MFAAFANPARLHILECLANGPASVNQIASATGLKQSMTSQHLSVLLSAGAVVCKPQGSLRVYSLRGPRVAQILQLVEQFHDVHLQSLRRMLGQEVREAVA